jgi:hypothetical protein
MPDGLSVSCRSEYLLSNRHLASLVATRVLAGESCGQVMSVVRINPHPPKPSYGFSAVMSGWQLRHVSLGAEGATWKSSMPLAMLNARPWLYHIARSA